MTNSTIDFLCNVFYGDEDVPSGDIDELDAKVNNKYK